MKKPVVKQRNLVSKHARTYNKSMVHVDRKKASKAGKLKHKRDLNDE